MCEAIPPYEEPVLSKEKEGQGGSEDEEHGTSSETNLQESSDPNLRESSVYLWAREHKLTSMETYEDFRPNDNVTRAEMAKIVVLYAESQNHPGVAEGLPLSGEMSEGQRG